MKVIYIVCVIALLGAMMVAPAAATTWDVYEGDSIRAVIESSAVARWNSHYQDAQTVNKMSILVAALICPTVVAPVMVQPTPFRIDGYDSTSNGNTQRSGGRVTNVNTGASFEHTHEDRVHIGASRIGDSGPSGVIAFANVVLEAGSTYATRWVWNSPDPDNQYIPQE